VAVRHDGRKRRALLSCLLCVLLVLPSVLAETGESAYKPGDGNRSTGIVAGPGLKLLASTPDGSFLAEKANFSVIHLEGDPSTIGKNHGTLLAEKVQRGMEAYAHCSLDWYGLGWSQCRELARSYWLKVPSEYQLEIQGIRRCVRCGCQ